MRGPALLAPFFTASLAWSHLRRRTVLWRPFTSALTVPVLGGVISATLVTVTLVGSGHAGPAAGAWFVLAGLGGSLLLVSAMLITQIVVVGTRRQLVLESSASADVVI